MAKRKTSRVRTIIKYVKRGGSGVRRGASRAASFKRQGEGKGFLSVKEVLTRKAQNILGAAIDVGTEVWSASTDNTYDDMVTSAPAKLVASLIIDFVGGRKYQHITSGMSGSAAGDWMRKKIRGTP